jgi:membrane-bound lytic murein transglycosylase D
MSFPVLPKRRKSTGRPLAAATGVLVGLGGVGASLSLYTRDVVREGAATAVAVVATVRSEQDWSIANLNHSRVDYWVGRFQDEDMRDKFALYLERSGRYEDMIRERLRERDMPEDLLYLAMIESGFSPKAYSAAAASGLWQFISETGRRHGLRVDGTIDERNDPERSTDAALDYLEKLHDRFGSWYLAAAAYNTGENRVGRIMKEVTGKERGTDQDYYRIWNRLPQETRDYVPLMIAAARISKHPELYGFGNVGRAEPLRYDVVITDAGFSLETVAKVSGADLEELKLLNPQLKKGRLPANERYELKLPKGTMAKFEADWSTAVEEQRAADARATAANAKAAMYKVRSGDNLGSIASKNHVTVAALKRVNGLKSNAIRVGQVLRLR